MCLHFSVQYHQQLHNVCCNKHKSLLKLHKCVVSQTRRMDVLKVTHLFEPHQLCHLPISYLCPHPSVVASHRAGRDLSEKNAAQLGNSLDLFHMLLYGISFA